MTDDSKMDPAVVAASRRYNFWLGGKDNYSTDRASADTIKEAFPSITLAVTENRKCLLRVVRHLASCGIRQFLDIGCGLPTPHDNVHNIAQQIAPDSRIVYVDNDPVVAVHSRALTISTPQGAIAFHRGDLLDPAHILGQVGDTLDLTRPVAVLLFAVAHFLPDDAAVATAVHDLTAALPSGSYLALSHVTFDPLPDDKRAALQPFTTPSTTHGPFRPRTRDEITALLTGLELTEPGLVCTTRWHPNLHPQADKALGDDQVITYAAVGRKP